MPLADTSPKYWPRTWQAALGSGTTLISPTFLPLKVPLTPKIFFLLKKSTSFPDFISEKIISIDKILAFLQAFEHVTSVFTTPLSGIWVGLLVTSLWEPS